jgi:hypothetical protein
MPESLTGSFDPDLLETTLNGHAADGSSKGSSRSTCGRASKPELVLVVERGGTPG